MKRFVYADNAATTAVAPEVIEAMAPCFTEAWGNPSSLYSKGREAGKLLAGARERIAALLGATAQEIYFTASGSEADNWAIKGAAHAHAKKGKHLITTAIEHHAVLHTMKSLEREGFTVTYLGVDADGFVSPAELEAAIRPDTILVAVMLANNEIGTIQPVHEIARICREHGVLCFTDAVQAVGSIPVDVNELGVDMLSFSGHKLSAPKGIGALYIKKGVHINDLIDGGGQERGHRGGTENLPYIIGLARALELAIERLPDMERVRSMRDRLTHEIAKISYSRINGSMENRLPGNLNAAFRFIEGESLLLLLDCAGICVSTGSACSTASLEPSHVLLAIGVPVEDAHGSLRITLSHNNTEADVDYIIEVLPGIVAKLRDMSPLWSPDMKTD